MTTMPPDDLTRFDASHLEALAQLEADERTIRALSEKAVLRREREAEIFGRVMADYDARMTAIAAQSEPVRQRVREDLQKLQALYQNYSEGLARARVQLQECEFRHEIGEFTPEEFERCQQTAERTIAERAAELDAATALRQRYLELLPNEPVGPRQAQPTPAQAAEAAAAPVEPPVVETPPAAFPAVSAGAVAPPPTPGVTLADARPPDDRTMFMRAPAASDFALPSAGSTDDSGEDRTVSLAAAILIEEHDGLPGTHHRLGVTTTIGRTPDNQIVVPVKEVSRRHAQIVVADEGYVLKDLDSPNGTFVNGDRITEHRLQEGDRIMLAGTTFVFSIP